MKQGPSGMLAVVGLLIASACGGEEEVAMEPTGESSAPSQATTPHSPAPTGQQLPAPAAENPVAATPTEGRGLPLEVPAASGPTTSAPAAPAPPAAPPPAPASSASSGPQRSIFTGVYTRAQAARG